MTAINLTDVVLKSGAHASPEDGMCVMELTAYIAREPFTDHPECTSPVLGAFLRSWNDALDTDTRQKLKPYAERVIGTNGKDEELAWMATDWLVRVQTPAWLRLAGLTEQALTLETLPELCADMDVPTIQSILNAVRKDADAAGAAAGAAAWDAAGAASGDAARAAAGAASGAAARDALKPTTERLQDSVFGLLDRMIEVAKASSA